MAKEASRATEMVALKRGVLETETRLAKEVVGVCKEYCAEVQVESLNRVGVPTNSEMRRAENIYFPEDIQEVSTRDGKGKEVQLLIKANQFKDNLTIKDVVSKAKDAESKSKAGDT